MKGPAIWILVASISMVCSARSEEFFASKYLKCEPAQAITADRLTDSLGNLFKDHKTLPNQWRIAREAAHLLVCTLDKDKMSLNQFSVNQLLALNKIDSRRDCLDAQLGGRRQACETFCLEEDCKQFRRSDESAKNAGAYLGTYCWVIFARVRQVCYSEEEKRAEKELRKDKKKVEAFHEDVYNYLAKHEMYWSHLGEATEAIYFRKKPKDAEKLRAACSRVVAKLAKHFEWVKDFQDTESKGWLTYYNSCKSLLDSIIVR